MPAGRFANLSITLMNLQGNRVRSLHAATFAHIAALQVLNLKRSLVEQIDEDAFAPVGHSLVDLDLEANRLSSMTTDRLTRVMSPLVHLTHLNLAANNLSAAPDLSRLRTLSDLNLARNRLVNIGVGMGSTLPLLPDSLLSLNLEGNLMEGISRLTFVQFVNLKNLDLTNNRIDWIDRDAFDAMRRLNTLVLKGNKLKSVPAITRLYSLERLDLSEQRDGLRKIENFAFNRDGYETTALKVDLSKNKIGL